MKRVQIIGYSGSGKTTLGRQLSARVGAPFYELDQLFWLPGWHEKPKQQYYSDVDKVTSEESWVICGNYLDRLDGLTLNRADTVVWLNYPIRTCLARMLRRTINRAVTREKLWGHSRESMINFIFRPKKSLFWTTLGLYRREGRRRHEDKLKQYGYSGMLIELTTPKETNKWLKDL